jgi:ADP-ribose pyrophosphatase YjhB (NUDIX family)
MADISIHNTKSIEISNLREVDGGRPFFTRDIVITDERGHTVTITCYANGDEGEELKVQL